jgi:hypothetical protein
MAFLREAAIGLILVGAVWGEEFRVPAKHDHWRKFCSGTLVVNGEGVSYKGRGEHAWNWTFQEIEQLTLGEKRIVVLSYQDVKWKLGADREFVFDVDTPAGLYEFLRGRLDQRFVAALADGDVKPLWQLPAKRLSALGGASGTLVAGEDRIVFRGAGGKESRTWRYSDIENISRSGPFDLSIVSFERSRAHYGSRKGFQFQLKEPLSEARYDELWRRLNKL